MYKGISLNEFIGELQKLAVEHGNDEISSIGSSSGKIAGMSSPFCFNFKGHDATEFVPAYQHDVRAKPSHVSGKESLRDDFNGTDGSALGLKGVDLPSVEHIEELVGQLRKYSEEEYDQHNNYIAEDLAEAAEVLDKLVVAREKAGVYAPVKLGDKVCVVFWGQDGKPYLDEAEVVEVSTHRFWTDSNYYDFDDIGRTVFLTPEAATKFIASPENVKVLGQQRVLNFLQTLDGMPVSQDTKRDVLASSFAMGQEFFEKDTGRYIRLLEKGINDIWTFDVFDKNNELLYSTSALAVQLAYDVLNGYIVPAAMAKEKSVDGLISEAVDVAKQSNQDIECAQQDFSK